MKHKFNVGDIVIYYRFEEVSYIDVGMIRKIIISSSGVKYDAGRCYRKDYFDDSNSLEFSMDNLELIFDKYKEYCSKECEEKIKFMDRSLNNEVHLYNSMVKEREANN